MSINQFIDSSTIAGRLNAQFKTIHFDPYLVGEYCARVEIEHVCDPDLMWRFREVPLTIGFEKMVLMPCNVYKIEDLYDDSDNHLTFDKTNTHLFNIRDKATDVEYEEGDVVYINYIGVPVDKDTGQVLIPAGHEIACETFCKIMFFEEDRMLGIGDPNYWENLNVLFSNQVMAVRSDYRHTTNEHLQKINIIRGNMLSSIGRMPLAHEKYK